MKNALQILSVAILLITLSLLPIQEINATNIEKPGLNERGPGNEPFPGIIIEKSAKSAIAVEHSSQTEDDELHPAKLVEDLFISGSLQVSNISFRGHQFQLGKFTRETDNPDFPLAEGIILSTGNVKSATGPNNSGSRTTVFNSHKGEPDLETLIDISADNIFDPSVLTFDFISDGDAIEFRYIFASEEYPEWACSQYNDVFGFFISGPGISGSFSNNAANIALLPDLTPVSINNIHVAGWDDGNNDGPGPLCPDINEPYYVSVPPGSTTIEYDGRTTVLTARIEGLQACETYSMKIAIADVSDGKWDSAVFLEAGSFSSTGAGLSIKNFFNAKETYDIFSQCNPYELRFSRNQGENTDSDQLIQYTIEGTATSQFHHTLASGEVTIPAGTTSISIPYEIIPAENAEGLTIVVKVNTTGPCNDNPVYLEKTIRIHDPFIIENLQAHDLTACSLQDGKINVLAGAGKSYFDYHFAYELLDINENLLAGPIVPGGNISAIFENLNNGLYKVRITDGASCQVLISDTITIDAPDAPSVEITGNLTVCENEQTELVANPSVSDASYLWKGPQGFTSTDKNVWVVEEGVYSVTITASNLCTATAAAEKVNKPQPQLSLSVSGDLTCQVNEVTLTAEFVGQVEWYFEDALVGTGLTLKVSAPGEYTAVATSDETNCTATKAILVNQNLIPAVVNISGNQLLTCTRDEITLYATSDDPQATILWNNGSETSSIKVTEPGLYSVTVTTKSGCTTESSVLVEQDILHPTIAIEGAHTLTCADPAATLTAVMSENAVISLWSSGHYGSSITVDTPGEYVVRAVAMNGCTAETSIRVDQDIEIPEVTHDPLPEICANELFALPGAGSYSGEGIIYENGEYLFSVTQAGTYILTYTEAGTNGCEGSIELSVTVNEVPVVTLDAFETFCGNATIILSGGLPAGGVYYVDGVEATELFAQEGKTYEITYLYTNDNGCVSQASQIINKPSPLVLSLVAMGAVSEFGGSDGFLEVAVSGGTPDYEFLWEMGETTPRIENLSAGSFSVVVFDANNCNIGGTWQVTGPTEPEEILIDLSVTIEVNIQTPDPEKVDELIFAVVVKNPHATETATGVIIDNIIPEPFPFYARLDDGTSGSYYPENGTWSIGSIPAGEHRILVYKTGMLLTTEKSSQSASNTAQIRPFDQKDPNLANNFAQIVVTVGESSGGGDNGIESNGSMAAQLTLRNHRRLVESNHVAREERAVKMEGFSQRKMLTGNLKTATVDGQYATGIGMMIPENGPASTKAFISTPYDLLGITNAKEIFSVDYLQENNARRAAILAISTESSAVYEHTKVICDRLMGGELRSIEMIEIAGKPFILSQLVHPNGYTDYSISFIAQKNGSEFVIDNRWYNEEYKLLNQDDIFNFQVWSVTPQFTRQLVEEILTTMDQNGGVSFRNEQIAPQIPQVYVHSGRYTNGGLLLKLVNKAGADQITIRGNKTLFENAPRELMDLTISIPTTENVEVFIPTGFLFDAGFSISNNKDKAPDILYYADGAWMFDYDPGNAVVTGFSTKAEDNQLEAIDHKVERDASFKGQVRTWASMFRSLSPRNMPVDMSAFDQIVFNASGEGIVEVMLAKQSVDQWSEQYRTSITLNPNNKEYRINFSDLATKDGVKGFTADDLVSVVFNPIGNGSTTSNFEVSVSNLHFANSKFVVTDNATFYPAYPNPFHHTTSMDLTITKDSHVKVEVLNVFGQTLEILANETMANGVYKLNWDASTYSSGIYMLRSTVGENVYTSKVILNK
jgi:hypothetical protein